jgi:hypothetical protein
MTDFLESVRPMEPAPPAEPTTLVEPSSLVEAAALAECLPVADEAPAEPSVRQLLTELAHLEDVVRTGGHLDGEVDDAAAEAEVIAAMAREQAIIDELHRRTTT